MPFKHKHWEYSRGYPDDDSQFFQSAMIAHSEDRVRHSGDFSFTSPSFGSTHYRRRFHPSSLAGRALPLKCCSKWFRLRVIWSLPTICPSLSAKTVYWIGQGPDCGDTLCVLVSASIPLRSDTSSPLITPAHDADCGPFPSTHPQTGSGSA